MNTDRPMPASPEPQASVVWHRFPTGDVWHRFPTGDVWHRFPTGGRPEPQASTCAATQQPGSLENQPAPPIHRPRSISTRLLAIVASWFTMIAGCTHIPHQTAVDNAEKQWNEVRAKIKLQLAEQQLRAGAIDDAKRTAAEAVLLEPALPDGYVVLARAHFEAGEPAKAEHALRTADEHGVRAASLAYTRGMILEQQGRYDDALAAYADADSIDPHTADHLIARAECLAAMGRFQEALALLRGRMDGHVADASLHMLAGDLATRTADHDAAALAYGRALVARPDQAAVREAYGLALLRIGRIHEARSMLRSICEDPEHPPSGDAVRGYARCAIATGDAEAARHMLTEYVRRAPRDLRAQVLLAQAAIATGDLRTALRSIDTAEGLAPRDPDVALMRAIVHIEQGRGPAAVESLSSVLDLRPDDVTAHCLLASTLEAAGDCGAARTHFVRALELRPDSQVARAGLEHLAAANATAPEDPAPPQSPTAIAELSSAAP